MSIYAQSADGAYHEFPDSTPSAAIDKAMAEYTKSAPAPKSAAQEGAERTAAEATLPEKLEAGLGHGMSQIGTGIEQRALQIGKMIGVPDADHAEKKLQEIIDNEKETSAPLLATKAGRVGDVIGQAAVAAPALAVPGTNTYAGSALIGAGLGAAQPTATGESPLANTAAGAVGGVVGKGAGDALSAGAQALLQRVAARQVLRQAANQARDQTLAASQSAGLVVPPSMMGSKIGSTIEGLAGKARTAQEASIKNQPQMQQIVRDAFNMQPGTKIEDGLATARRDAGQAYDDLRAYPQPFKATPTYLQSVQSLNKDSGALSGFPSLSKNEAVEELQKELSVPELTPDTAVALSKQLGYNGRLNIRSQDPKIADYGRAQLSARKAVDDMIQENLNNSGVPELGEDFRHARMTIAQTHAVEDALGKDGNTIDARKLANSRATLTGPLKTLADFGGTFPKAAQTSETGSHASPFSVLDYAAGVAGFAHNPAMAAAVLARPAARYGILSSAGQKAFSPSYGSGALETIANGATSVPARSGLTLSGAETGADQAVSQPAPAQPAPQSGLPAPLASFVTNSLQQSQQAVSGKGLSTGQ